MHWSLIPTRPSTRILRQFAAAWLFFLLLAGMHQYVTRNHHTAGVVLLLLAVGLGGLGLSRPGAVRWLFIGCMVLTYPIGWVVSQVMLMLMFYCIITPVALFFKLTGRDLLIRKPDRARTSFWEPKSPSPDVSSYFRQY